MVYTEAMKPTRRRIYEDDAKVLYEGKDPNTLIQSFKDQTPVAGAAPLLIEGKGVLNNRISAHLMEHLATAGVPTHFIRRLNMREQLVRASERLPFCLRIHNYATDSFAENFSLEPEAPLPRAIVEYYLRPEPRTENRTENRTETRKELGKHPPVRPVLISDEHITAFNWATTWEMDEVFHLALRINDFLSGFCLGAGLRLSRVDLSFGRIWEEDHTALVLVDEITPDSCRLWDLQSNRPLLPEVPDPPAVKDNATAGKVVELQPRPNDNSTATNTAQRARLYQHLYREVAQRFGVLTDAETLARDDNQRLFPAQNEEAEQGTEPPKPQGEEGREAHKEPREETRGVVLPMRRDPRRLSPRLRHSRKGEEARKGDDPSPESES